MGANVEVTVAGFRSLFVLFSDTTKYPDAVIQLALNSAQNYVSPLNIGNLRDDARAYAIYLMAAHVQTLTDRIASGNGQGIIGIQTGATIGSVSVSATPPPMKNQYDYWLNLTPYGSQLLFLLATYASVGIYAGGSDENVFR